MTEKPYIIGIAGDSGVGKSTITGIVQLYYGSENTVVISTDDLHKWERSSPNWNEFTHLNPEANNLELGDIQLNQLRKNESIYRSVYDHDTGNFKAPIKLSSKKIVINEGLHAFYTEKSRKITDLKIFVNTEDTLRTHWKIIRDTEKRGYKYNVVLDTIEKRKKDAAVINAKQIEVADVIVNIQPEKPILNVGDKHEAINVIITYEFINNVNTGLFNFINDYNLSLKNFVSLSNTIGNSLELCQDAGGNVSVKTSDYMIIKASGHTMKSVSNHGGYSIVKHDLIANSKDSNEYDDLLKSSDLYKGKRPSMEVGFHALLKKYVIHSHPIYVTALLCTKNSKSVIRSLYSKYKYEYIDYVNPGYDLYKAIKDKKSNKDVYFLENHGLIITSDNVFGLVEKFTEINLIAKKYLSSKIKNFKEFDLSHVELNQKNKTYLFPDAVVFHGDQSKVETRSANNYIDKITSQLKSKRCISDKDALDLLMMESEKHRKTL